MDITIPTAIKSLSASGSAMKAITLWLHKSKGDSRSLISELKENLSYLDMVAEDNIPLEDVIKKISILEFKRLSKEGFNFNKLKRAQISHYPSLQNTDLAK